LRASLRDGENQCNLLLRDVAMLKRSFSSCWRGSTVFAQMKDSKKHKGFTLTELLIVLLIVAILVVIAIPHYTAFMNKIKELAGWF